MEKMLAIVGALTIFVGALTGLMKGINYLIRESSLVANSLWEIKRYGFKRLKKNGSGDIID